MAVNSLVGLRVSIATGVGATVPQTTAAGYAALTWVPLGEVESIGEYGDTSTDITFTSITSSRTSHYKGSRDAGAFPVVCAYDSFDPGQDAMLAAEKEKFTYNIRIEYADKLDANDTNGIDYMGCKVMSERKSGGSVNDIDKITFNLGINTAITRVKAAVVP